MLAQWDEDGEAMASVALEGVDGIGFASRVPLAELAPNEERSHYETLAPETRACAG